MISSHSHDTHQFDTAGNLPLIDQFQAIQNLARLEAIDETSECLEHTVTLIEITPKDLTPDIYWSLADFEKCFVHDQLEIIYFTLQTSIDSILTEDQDPGINPVADTLPQEATGTHWLPSLANSHVQVQKDET